LARPSSHELLDPRELDALEQELGALVACGARHLVLDFRGISQTSSRLATALAKVHRAFEAAGGLLELRGLCPELASAVADAGIGDVVQIMSEEPSAVAAARPVPTAMAPPPVSELEQTLAASAMRQSSGSNGTAEMGSAAKPRRRRAGAAFDEKVCTWLGTMDEFEVDSSPEAIKRPAGPPVRLAAALRDRSLKHRFLLDVLVLDPRPRRLECDPAIGPIRRVLAAIREEPGLRRVVIDFSHVIRLSVSVAEAVAHEAIALAVAGGTLRLSQVQPVVMETILQSRLNRVTKSFSTVDEAVLARWD
jgi:anti-anti-sigma regulatory factor